MDKGKPNTAETRYEAIIVTAGTAHSMRYLYENIATPTPHTVTIGGVRNDTASISLADREAIGRKRRSDSGENNVINKDAIK
ncbi:MAG: hypothetical protein JSV35_00400 [Candidatus Bathyarchaeota archaeon]|nr:MAG: hypothetical protein JSV35_00400 [Candidatus Bathyarchaeota archaeon]